MTYFDYKVSDLCNVSFNGKLVSIKPKYKTMDDETEKELLKYIQEDFESSGNKNIREHIISLPCGEPVPDFDYMKEYWIEIEHSIYELFEIIFLDKNPDIIKEHQLAYRKHRAFHEKVDITHLRLGGAA